jgi:hypothetical protein
MSEVGNLILFSFLGGALAGSCGVMIHFGEYGIATCMAGIFFVLLAVYIKTPHRDQAAEE